jgi:hypothetical protein
MNIKFSQLPVKPDVNLTDIFPILRSGNNFTVSVGTVYNLLSGDKIIDVYTSYSQNSSIFINDSAKLQNVYTEYSENSGNYVSYGEPKTLEWDDVYTSWNEASATLINSNTTGMPTATAIKNIIAIPSVDYAALTVKDPYTYYIVV